MATCTKYREIVELRLTINIHGCILEAGERSSPFRGIGSGETYRLGKAADEKGRIVSQTTQYFEEEKRWSMKTE